MRATAPRAMLLLTGAALLSACGTVAGVASGDAPTSSTPSRDMHGAPHVQHPLNVQQFVKAPCSVLSDAQVQQLNQSISMGIEPQPDMQYFAGPTCRWNETYNASATNLDVTFATNGRGLPRVYANRRDFAVFEPKPSIDGYPVVHTAQNKDSTSCGLAVGVSDNLHIDVGSSAPISDDGSDPCANARTGATAVLQTLKGGG